MSVMQENKRNELRELYTRLIFPRQGDTWSSTKWTTCGGITMVTMWDKEHMLTNIKYAMILEQMGIGPTFYCIFTNWMPFFESRVLFLMHYLPHQKMCFYPPRFTLRGLFLRSAWKEIGQEICRRHVSLKNPLFRTFCYTQQQYMVFKQTGVMPFGLANESATFRRF